MTEPTVAVIRADQALVPRIRSRSLSSSPSSIRTSCIARVLDRFHAEDPDFGRDLAIDASDKRVRRIPSTSGRRA